MDFVPIDFKMDSPKIILSKPFLINKNSSPTTIMKFINERIDLMIDILYLDDYVLYAKDDLIGPIINLRYSKVIFL
jgi:hypothetical protein